MQLRPNNSFFNLMQRIIRAYASMNRLNRWLNILLSKNKIGSGKRINLLSLILNCLQLADRRVVAHVSHKFNHNCHPFTTFHSSSSVPLRCIENINHVDYEYFFFFTFTHRYAPVTIVKNLHPQHDPLYTRILLAINEIWNHKNVNKISVVAIVY